MNNRTHETRWFRVFVIVATILLVLTTGIATTSASRSIRDSGGSAAPAPAAPAAPATNAGDRTLRGAAPVAAPQIDTPPATVNQAPVETGACRDGEEWAMLELINSYRVANGLGSLQMTQTLSNAAEFHSADMASANYFDHTLSNGASWADNIWSAGYTYDTYLAENIAAGNPSAAATFQQWVNSPGHNANMLNPTISAIGIGRASSGGSDFGTYWTTTFGGIVDGGGC